MYFAAAMNEYYCHSYRIENMTQNFYRILRALVLLNMPLWVAGAVEQPIHQQSHLDALSVYKKNADDYCAKNLNRFGLSQLYSYDAAQDSMYKNEMGDTLAAIRNNYDKSHETRSSTIASLNEQIKDLSAKKERATTNFARLLKKACIASLIWLAIIFVLIRIRSSALKHTNRKLDESKAQLSESEERLNAGKELVKLSLQNAAHFDELNQHAVELQKISSENLLVSEAQLTKEEAVLMQSSIQEVIKSAALNSKMTAAILSQEFVSGTDKVASNLNELCNQCFDLVYYGTKSADEELKITVSKDLEKNLPLIKIVPEATVQLILNVLLNAFQAVREKQDKKIKGYIPKISISTRVLPRFLQVRVRDNGDGMTDEIIQQVSTQFFTTKSAGHSSGLGMYFAKKIASELHQGELKIESEPGNSTDVYIKFFTS